MTDIIRTIAREELQAKLDAGDEVKLVMTLHEWAYRAARIPGSLHFATVEQAYDALDTDDEIVVYCSDPACVASQYAYHALVERGYTNVRRYAGGLADWAVAGLPLDSDHAAPTHPPGVDVTQRVQGRPTACTPNAASRLGQRPTSPLT